MLYFPGTPVNRIPIMAKQTLDLYELFRLVVSKGGLVEVINKKLWREITKGLNLPSSITSAAFTLRTQWVLLEETQRRQYEGHNTPLGYHTDQGPCIVAWVLPLRCFLSLLPNYTNILVLFPSIFTI